MQCVSSVNAGSMLGPLLFICLTQKELFNLCNSNSNADIIMIPERRMTDVLSVEYPISNRYYDGLLFWNMI